MLSERPTLGATGLPRSFGSGEVATVAVHEVSLGLYSGEFTLLMGPSGSGKSTLLAACSGLLRPDNGHVSVMGKDIWHMTGREREAFRLKYFGFIFQGYNLF